MSVDCGKIEASRESAINTFPALTNSTFEVLNMAKDSLPKKQSLRTIYAAEVRSYAGAKSRCTNPKTVGYHRYGGRGIEFRFNSFEQFFEVLGPKPTPKHSVDRYPDYNGHYEPGNVRWATTEEQATNKEVNVRITHNGETHVAQEWSLILGLSKNGVGKRLKEGWCESCAVTLPGNLKGRRLCPHMPPVVPVPSTCSVCGEVFSSQKALNSHSAIHGSEYRPTYLRKAEALAEKYSETLRDKGTYTEGEITIATKAFVDGYATKCRSWKTDGDELNGLARRF